MLSCMSNGGRYGVIKALEGMLGASLGNLCLVGLSALGLGLIVNNNDFLFYALKWAGALYLVVLGIQLIRQPMAASKIDKDLADKSPSLWLSSFIIAVSNPKGLIYFGALFPQFITYNQPLIIQFSLMTLTFLIIDFVWMLAYAAAGQKIMGWLKNPTHQTLFNAISGAILIAAGLFMALTGKN